MKTKFYRRGLMSLGMKIIAPVVAALLALNALVSNAPGQGTTAFTYQGQLLSNGTNVEGTNGMIFTLFSSPTGNTPVGTPTAWSWPMACLR